MDNLNIDFKSLLPYAIDAYTEIYGEEYRSIISERINNATIILYHDVEGLNEYIKYIKNCKRREYAIKFLEKIGIDVKKYKKDNYTQELDDEIEEILGYYIHSSEKGFSVYFDYYAPLWAFKENESANPLENKVEIDKKISLINYLLGSEHEKITKENFDDFTKTKEYLEILNKINELNIIYKDLLIDYLEWEIKLQPYEEYIKNEEKRKEDILKKNKISIFLEIYSNLPLSVRKIIFNKTTEEQCNTVLGNMDIGSESLIESFKTSNFEKLSSSDVDLYDKYWIIHYQSKYLENLGVVIPNKDILECKSEEDVKKYLDFIKQDNVKKYIPNGDLIAYITFIREIKYENAICEYYITREDFRKKEFTNALEIIGNKEENFELFYETIKNKRIGVTGGINKTSTSDNALFVSIMFYTISINTGGHLAHAFIHELGHVIDECIKGSGFEFIENDSSRNPYDKKYRKYERFNEVINDIFTIEVNELLRSKGIYLIEPKEFTKSDSININTHSIIKEILQPLVQKFRKHVIKAKVNAEPEELTKYIGVENFEELVDAVNKTDYLVRNGVMSKINNSIEDEMVKEYFEEVERVKKIYVNIDNYYRDNHESLSPNDEIDKVNIK